ncbi:MAG: polyprenyl synthetase family protein, partial [Gluconobacter potus]|uniref:polyprenyl synthetase family protein n=1 Tax=Gluconobacter potus TaxID=2724927 RepID=UPI0039EBA487
VYRYLDVILGKTADLFAGACRVGAVVSDRPDAEELALDRFGTNLGMAFQLVDDALDYAADQQVLGKTVGDDMREGKITLPVLAAYEAGSPEDRVFWERVIEKGEQTEADLPHALALIEKTGAIATTIARAQAYAAEAVDALSIFPDSELRRLMTETVQYTVDRAR